MEEPVAAAKEKEKEKDKEKEKEKKKLTNKYLLAWFQDSQSDFREYYFSKANYMKWIGRQCREDQNHYDTPCTAAGKDELKCGELGVRRCQFSEADGCTEMPDSICNYYSHRTGRVKQKRWTETEVHAIEDMYTTAAIVEFAKAIKKYDHVGQQHKTRKFGRLSSTKSRQRKIRLDMYHSSTVTNAFMFICQQMRERPACADAIRRELVGHDAFLTKVAMHRAPYYEREKKHMSEKRKKQILLPELALYVFEVLREKKKPSGWIFGRHKTLYPHNGTIDQAIYDIIASSEKGCRDADSSSSAFSSSSSSSPSSSSSSSDFTTTAASPSMLNLTEEDFQLQTPWSSTLWKLAVFMVDISKKAVMMVWQVMCAVARFIYNHWGKILMGLILLIVIFGLIDKCLSYGAAMKAWDDFHSRLNALKYEGSFVTENVVKPMEAFINWVGSFFGKGDIIKQVNPEELLGNAPARPAMLMFRNAFRQLKRYVNEIICMILPVLLNPVVLSAWLGRACAAALECYNKEQRCFDVYCFMFGNEKTREENVAQIIDNITNVAPLTAQAKKDAHATSNVIDAAQKLITADAAKKQVGGGALNLAQEVLEEGMDMAKRKAVHQVIDVGIDKIKANYMNKEGRLVGCGWQGTMVTFMQELYQIAIALNTTLHVRGVEISTNKLMAIAQQLGVGVAEYTGYGAVGRTVIPMIGKGFAFVSPYVFTFAKTFLLKYANRPEGAYAFFKEVVLRHAFDCDRVYDLKGENMQEYNEKEGKYPVNSKERFEYYFGGNKLIMFLARVMGNPVSAIGDFCEFLSYLLSYLTDFMPAWLTGNLTAGIIPNPGHIKGLALDAASYIKNIFFLGNFTGGLQNGYADAIFSAVVTNARGFAGFAGSAVSNLTGYEVYAYFNAMNILAFGVGAFGRITNNPKAAPAAAVKAKKSKSSSSQKQKSKKAKNNKIKRKTSKLRRAFNLVE